MNVALSNPGMEVPCEFVRRMNMTPEERALADASEREWLDKAILRGAAFTEGKEEGKAEGYIDVAKAMLAAGEPRDKILKFSRLTEDELNRLQ